MDGVVSRILAKPWMLGLKTDDMHGDFIFIINKLIQAGPTFHCPFEEHFAAATRQDTVVAPRGLVRAHQAELGRWSRGCWGCGWRRAYIWPHSRAERKQKNTFNWDRGKHRVRTHPQGDSSAHRAHQKQLNQDFWKTQVKLYGFFTAYLAASRYLPLHVSEAKFLAQLSQPLRLTLKTRSCSILFPLLPHSPQSAQGLPSQHHHRLFYWDTVMQEAVQIGPYSNKYSQ